MPTAEATVETDRASRYLVQLARHGSQLGRSTGHRPRTHGAGGAPPDVQHTEWSDTHGIIKFGWGQCVLQATPEGLTLHAEAADEQNLRRIQDGIAARLEKIGRRDQLKVTWRQTAPSTDSPDAATDAPAAHLGPGSARRERLGAMGLVAAIALAIAVHVGLGGALLTHARWTSWATDVVLALVVVKVLVIGGFTRHRHRHSSKVSKTLRNLH